MAVYVDAAIWHHAGRRWCHLMADDEAELHRFAFRLGLQLSSYQGPPRTATPHYDITGFERNRAVRMGALPSSREEIVAVLRRVKTDYRPPLKSRRLPSAQPLRPEKAEPGR